MLDPTERNELVTALRAFEKLIEIRLEERRLTQTGSGTPPGMAAMMQRRIDQFETVNDEALPPLSAYGSVGPLAQLIKAYDLSETEAAMVTALLAVEIDEKFAALCVHLSDRPCPGGELSLEILRNLGARTMNGRLLASDMLGPRARLRQARIIRVDTIGGVLLAHSAKLNPDLAPWLMGLSTFEPEFSPEFPAHRLETVHTLPDLVVEQDTLQKLEWLMNRVRYRKKVVEEWGFGATQDNALGINTLFHGPPGTGKTMAAAIIGREVELPVFRIDLSALVSKYIGETQKNLERIFDRAETQDWILCFDEADAIFGRRGEVHDARDRYANQDVSYLLQRLEAFSGITILTTNLIRNMDDAFMRRLQIQVGFRKPDAAQRAVLWRRIVPPHLPLHKGVDFDAFAEQFAMTGAEIRNVVFHAAYRAAADGSSVNRQMILEGVRAEYEKAGRMMANDGEMTV